jgi:hypothetical protein
MFSSSRQLAALAVVAALGLSAPAFAKDSVSPSAIAASSHAGLSTVPGNSSNIHFTFDAPNFVGPQAATVTVSWVIEQGNNVGGPGNQTSYPQTVNFSVANESGFVPVTGLGVAPTTCTQSGAPTFTPNGPGGLAALCQTVVSFTTPEVTVDGLFRIKLDASGNTGNGGLMFAGNVQINGTAKPALAAKLDTTLEVPSPQCHVLNAGTVNLLASLEESLSGDPIGDAPIDFSVDGSDVGTADTDGNGLASRPFNVNSLTAGAHDLLGAFAGNQTYNASDDSGDLILYYNFVGFQPPINPEGNSIFGNGRVLPVKIKLVDANLQPVANAQPQLSLFRLTSSTTLGEELEVASVSSADTGNYMRYVADDQQYIYNLELSTLTNGTYRLFVDLGDDGEACGQGPYSVLLTVAKKGKK